MKYYINRYHSWEFSQEEDDTAFCPATVKADIEKGYQCHPSISHHWGQYSPYFTIPSAISASVPRTCRITFAQVLARHGAREPTHGKTVAYEEFIRHIQRSVAVYPGKYAFLSTYRYQLGADRLTLFGLQQLFNMGRKVYQRYQSLAKDTIPYVRASGQDRVVASAHWWMKGYEVARNADPTHTGPDYIDGYPATRIDEGATFNNTLSHSLCTSFESGPYSHVGTDAQAGFAASFTAPIRERINADLPGANLTAAHVIYLMDLCPFETVFARPHPRHALPLSPFCHLFTHAEWRDYDYFQSLGKFYGFAQGNPMGPTQGVGFANELVARLTQTPVVDYTSTNRTLVADPEMFPLNATIYADFSHDNDMMMIFAALRLFETTAPPSKEKIMTPEQMNGYSAAWAVPFAARLYVEKMACEGEEEELVRVLLNDRVVPLQGCGADALGRCRLGAYVESLEFARGGGEWDKCFL